MSELANLARALHRRGLTPTQIRNRTGFLDSRDEPYIPIATIQQWLTEMDGVAATPRMLSASPSHTPQPPVSPVAESQRSEDPRVLPETRALPEGPKDHRALHEKMALMEAQLQRLTLERLSRSPSPPSPVPQERVRRSRGGSPVTMQLDDNRELVNELKHMNSQLMAQLAAANQLIVAALGAADRRDSAPPPPVGPAVTKPFKDWLPQVTPFSGETDRTPEAFLAQYYLYVRQQRVPAAERARQLIGKLTGLAQSWYTLTFANDPGTATESQIALGLRKAFGKEYAGVRALRAMYHVIPHPTQSGAQRLLALDQREQQALQHRVPRDAGPHETRFCRVLALFLPEELSPFLSELTADSRCSEETLRQLEEDPALFEDPDAAGRASFMPTCPAREALFAARVQLAEAALRRIQAPPPAPTRARLARADGGGAALADPSPEPSSTVTPPPLPPAAARSPPGIPDDYSARCSRVTSEHATQSTGTEFVGPPHYFGDNEDSSRRAKNQAEMKRRRANGFCFKCRLSDVKEVPFLECPLHGALASDAQAATVGRTRVGARAPKRG